MISYALQSAANSEHNDVVWSPDLEIFVAVGAGGLIETSPDGSTWTTQTSPFIGTPPNVTSVAWSAALGLFVIGASGSGATGGIATSSDGVTWTLQSTPWNAGPRVTCVAASPTRLIAGRFAGAGRIISSADGITWTTETTPFDSLSLFAAGWSDELGLFIAGGDPGPEVIMTSPDGSAWTARSSPFDGGQLVGVGDSAILDGALAAGYDSTGAVTLITSLDGVTWTAQTTPFDGSGGNGLAVFDGGASLIVATGRDPTGAITVATSPDGVVWSANASPFDSVGYVNAVAYSPTLELSVLVGYPASDATATGALSPAPLAGAQPFWTVEHYEHEFVPDGVHSLTLEADGSLIQTVRPENLHFVLNLAQVGGVSTIDYELSINARDDDGNPVVSPDFVGPYRTDFLLKRSDLDDPVMGGMHTEVSGQDGEEPISCVKISGKDWLHYLERRIWPYDADLSYIDWPDGFRFKVTTGEVGRIVQDILETIRDLSNNFPGPPTSLLPSYSLQFDTDIDDTGVDRNYEISNFDSSTIFALIQALSQQGLGLGGFDFYMTPFLYPDRTFKLVAPEIGDPGTPIFELTVDATPSKLRSLGFTNTGPEWTHLIGVGAGTSNQQGGINKHFPASSAVFRRLDGNADFGNLKNLDTLVSLTSLQLAFGSNPTHSIPVEVNPRDIPDFWTLARPGKYVNVVYDLGFHQVNSIQKIISMDCTIDTEGEERVLLSFNQSYDASDNSGIADW